MTETTSGTRHFLEQEIENYRENVRSGNIDAAGGFHPTLASAVDSLMQWPDDSVMLAFGYEDRDDIGDLLEDLISLTWLLTVHGPDALLVDLVE